MSTLPMTFPGAPRTRPLDFLMLALWSGLALLCLASHAPAFFTSAVAGGALLIGRHFYTTAQCQRQGDGDLIIAACGPLCLIVSGVSLSLVTRFTPCLYDSTLTRLDFGVAPAVRLIALSHWWIATPVHAAYAGLPFAMMLAVLLSSGYLRRRLVISIAIGGVLVVPIYILFPAVGPIHVGDPNAPRNCMPSMHLTWALLLWANSRGLTRWAAAGFAFLTAVATLATGEHYLPDLLVALPWSRILTAISARFARWSIHNPLTRR